jgi:hypothetical protein
MKTSLPASILKTNDVIDFLNSPGQSFWNGGLQDLCSVSNFFRYGLEVVSTQVSNAVWVNADGKAQLNYTLTTVSDPVTAQQINASLWLMIGVAVTAIGALLILIPPGIWFDIIGLILMAAGVLTILDIGVVEVSNIVHTIFGSTAGKILIAGIGVALIAGVGLMVYGVATSAQARQNVRSVAEYTTGKVAEYTPKVAHVAGTVAGQAYSTAKAYAPQVAQAVKSTASKAYNYVTQ